MVRRTIVENQVGIYRPAAASSLSSDESSSPSSSLSSSLSLESSFESDDSSPGGTGASVWPEVDVGRAVELLPIVEG